MNRLFRTYAISGSLLLLTAHYGHAQVQDYASDDVIEKEPMPEPLEENNYPATAETLNDRADGAQSDPYFTNDWVEGQVMLDGGTEYENIPLKYDIYRNEVVIRRGEGKTAALDSENIRSFTLGPPRLANLSWFQRAKYVNGFDEVPDEQFVQVIHEGESKLLAVHRKQAEPQEAGGSSGQPSDQLGPTQTTYYYISPQGKVSVFEPNREAAIELLKDKEEVVRDFIEEATLDFDNVADLARLIIFYDREAN